MSCKLEDISGALPLSLPSRLQIFSVREKEEAPENKVALFYGSQVSDR